MHERMLLPYHLRHIFVRAIARASVRTVIQQIVLNKGPWIVKFEAAHDYTLIDYKTP